MGIHGSILLSCPKGWRRDELALPLTEAIPWRRTERGTTEASGGGKANLTQSSLTLSSRGPQVPAQECGGAPKGQGGRGAVSGGGSGRVASGEGGSGSRLTPHLPSGFFQPLPSLPFSLGGNRRRKSWGWWGWGGRGCCLRIDCVAKTPW